MFAAGCLAALGLLALPVHAGDTVNEDAPGHNATNGTPFDLQGFILRQIQAGTHRVVIPPGRYRVTPRDGTHLRFQNLTNVEIIAEGVEMICTETRPAIRLNQCDNLRLRGLTVDYDPLPMTEGRITALAPDKSRVEFQIFDGYPDDNLVERIEIYDPATGELRRASYYNWGSFERTAPGHYRVSKGANYHYSPNQDTEQVGDILVTSQAFPASAGGHAVELSRCNGVTLADVTLYASPEFGFLESECNRDTYLRCKIDRRPPESDPVRRGWPRLRSLDADAFHSTGALQGPAILDCVARFMGDDAVNIHGQYLMVTACTGAVLRVAAPWNLTIATGDPVEFLPLAGERPPDARVMEIAPASSITDEEKALVRKISMYQPIKDSLLAGTARFYRVTLDHPVDLPMGSMVAAANRLGNGFLVKGCQFGYNRSRGILIKASHGQLIDNTITHGWMSAVLVTPEHWWFEAGASSDVLVAGNRIDGCHEPAIQVLAPGGDDTALAAGAHRGITITNNAITDSVQPNIKVTSTAGLVIQNNVCERRPGAANGNSGEAIVTLNCSGVTLQTNRMGGP